MAANLPDYPAPVTTYTLRSASPAKTRCDAVVVGVVQTSKGPELADGGEDVAKAYGRKLRPLLSSLGVTGKAGEVVKLPTSGTLSSPLLVLVGLGKEPGTTAVRRAAGVAARGVTNAASVALALPADTPELVRAVTEGYRLGGYAFTTYKKNGDGKDKPGEVVVLSSAARRKEVIAAFADAQLVADAVAGDPRLGEHPARATSPRRRSPTRSPRPPRSSPPARARRRSRSRSSTRSSSPSSAAAASSASAPARRRRPGWSS